MAFNIFATATSDIPLANLDANFTMIGSSAVASTLYPTATTSITYGTAGTSHIFSGSIGAFTLGGTVAGGGNQLNNVIIGTTTPLAGAFTTLSATGTLSGGTSGTGYSFSGSAPATSLTLDTSGNLGLGVTTSAASVKTFEIGTIGNGIESRAAAITGLTQNTYFNTNFKYAVTGRPSSAFELDTGAFYWYTAASGTAGNNISFTQAMTLDASGNLGIGATSPAAKLDVRDVTQAYTTNCGSFSIINSANTNIVLSMGIDTTLGTNGSAYINAAKYGTAYIPLLLQPNSGNVGIGTTAPNYKLEIGTDSAGKPGVGGLWTVVSDERIKSNIVPANLDRCYEIVKSVPLKHFSFAPGVYTDDQIQDKHNLGWIAQDVQKVFKNAVSVKPFTLKTDIPDGVEEYEEQDFTIESVEKTETSIQVINGNAVQVSKVSTLENKVMLFDTVDVLDEAGAVVMDGDKPLTYQMPRMITKTRLKVRHDVIEDCLDLNSGQMIAALYGCVQALMAKVETLEAK